MIAKVKFDDAALGMEPADWLFCLGRNWYTRGIRIASLSPFSHVGMVGFRREDHNQRSPILLDVVQWRGGRAVSLKEEVERHPGVYVWYRVNPKHRWRGFNRQAAVDRMWQFTGTDYGWWSLGKASLAYLPGIRLFQKLDSFLIDDAATDRTPPFCSMAVAIATEAGGVDPVNNLRHSMTTPGHLAQSLFAEQVGALVP